MANSLQALELERAELRQKFLAVGDLRPGIDYRHNSRCGKPSCHCAKANDPGHDPQFRLTRKVNGKSDPRAALVFHIVKPDLSTA